MRGRGQDAGQDAGRTQRVTVPVAAEALGIREGALRKRIARGTVDHERDDEGHVWVYVASDERVDDGQDTGHPSGQGPLVEALRSQVADLREQLAQAHERDRENRRIIAGLVSRVPQLEAPETSESAAPSDAPAESSEAPETGAESLGTKGGSDERS
jgi:hypothetical protein